MNSKLCSHPDGSCTKAVRIEHGQRECTITSACGYKGSGRRQIRLDGLIGNHRLTANECAELKAVSEMMK